jgi:hypothetical protein
MGEGAGCRWQAVGLFSVFSVLSVLKAFQDLAQRTAREGTELGHKEAISIAVLNSSGRLVMECIIETKASTILQFVHGLSGSLHVTFELILMLLAREDVRFL